MQFSLRLKKEKHVYNNIDETLDRPILWLKIIAKIKVKLNLEKRCACH